MSDRAVPGDDRADDRRAREAVAATGPAASPLSVSTMADEADAVDATLLRRLAAAGRPDPEVVRGWARVLADAVVGAATAAPVLDLASDRGEWLDVWAELGIEASGVDDVDERVEALRGRGHDVASADPLSHLAERPAGSLGAVTAAVLADVGPLVELVDLVDHAREALRPGGLLVLAAADLASGSTADPQWADPRRRLLHPATLTLLALERGFAEADVVVLPGDAPAYALVARTAGGPGPTR